MARCGLPDCGMSKNARVHSRHEEGGHGFVDPTKPWSQRSSEREIERIGNQAHLKVPLLDYCEARDAGEQHACFGELTRHHVLGQAQQGPDTADNIRTVCAEHNRLLSQNAEVMRWGLRHGFRRKGSDRETA